MCACFIISTVFQKSQIIGIGRKKLEEIDKMLTVVIFWQRIYTFIHIFLNVAFSKILNVWPTFII